MRSVWRSAAAALAGAALMLSACVGPDADDDGPVVVTRVGNLGDAPTLFALERGYFDDAGVPVESVVSRGGTEMLAAVVTGQVDVLYLAVTPALLASFARDGAGHRAVAVTAVVTPDSCPYLGMSTSAGMAARLDAGGALEGPVRIGWFGTTLVVDAYIAAVMDELRARGATPEVVRLGRADQTAALATGDIDLGVETEPALTLAAERAGGRVAFPAGERVAGPMSVLLFGPRLVADRGLGRRVLEAWLRGLDDYRSGPTDADLALLSEATTIAPELLTTMCWPTIDPDGRAVEQGLQVLQEAAVAAGTLPAVVPADRIWDHGLLQDALAARVGSTGTTTGSAG